MNNLENFKDELFELKLKVQKTVENPEPSEWDQLKSFVFEADDAIRYLEKELPDWHLKYKKSLKECFKTVLDKKEIYAKWNFGREQISFRDFEDGTLLFLFDEVWICPFIAEINYSIYQKFKQQYKKFLVDFKDEELKIFFIDKEKNKTIRLFEGKLKKFKMNKFIKNTSHKISNYLYPKFETEMVFNGKIGNIIFSNSQIYENSLKVIKKIVDKYIIQTDDCLINEIKNVLTEAEKNNYNKVSEILVLIATQETYKDFISEFNRIKNNF